MSLDSFRALGVFVQRGFLDLGLRRDIATAMRNSKVAEAAVLATPGGYRVDAEVRRAMAVGVASHLIDHLKNRFATIKPAIDHHFNVTLSDAEHPQCLRYTAGDFFRPHVDAGTHENSARTISAVVFINDEGSEPGGEYQGGSLRLFGLMEGPHWAHLGMSLKAEAGLLVAFRSTLRHEVQRVISGERLTVVTWYRARPVGRTP